MLTLSTYPIKIKTAARDNYNLADWQIFLIHTSKCENVEFNGKRTHVISETTGMLIQHLTEAKYRAVPNAKHKTLPHLEDITYIINISEGKTTIESTNRSIMMQ